mmetsp:Transcript_30996/g.52355  ORF Transcript_30996/g.52355 Transcript_30996/m.52355 type:complete len:341 (-) Transcript_30996:759-1781(-)
MCNPLWCAVVQTLPAGFVFRCYLTSAPAKPCATYDLHVELACWHKSELVPLGALGNLRSARPVVDLGIPCFSHLQPLGDILEVHHIFNVGLPRRRDFLLVQRFPIQVSVPCVCLDVASTARAHAEAVRGLLGQQLGDEVLRRSGEVHRELRVRLDDPLEDGLAPLLVEEGGARAHHFVHEDAVGPPVHRDRVLLPLDQLRGHVLDCAAEGLQAVLRDVSHVVLGEAKVCEHDVPLHVHQNVLQLEVSVHDAVLVQEVKREAELRSVEARAHLLEAARATSALNVREQVPARVVVRDHVQLALRLEGEVHGHDVGVVDLVQDVALRFGVRDLALLRDHLLV